MKDLHEHLLSGWRFKAMVTTLILSVLIYFLITLWGGWRDVLHAFFLVGWKGIIVALGLSLINYFLRFKRWERFLKEIGHSLPIWSNLRIYMAGFALTTTPGKAGEALRGVFLRDYGIAYRHSFGVFLSERISDLLAILIIAMLGLWSYAYTRILIAVVALIVVFVLYAVQQDHWLSWTKNKVENYFEGRFAHFTEFCLETIMAFRSAFSTKMLIYGTFLGILAWGAEGLAFYYFLQLLQTDIHFLTAQFIYAFSLLIGAVTLLPGGIGGAEVTMIQALLFENVSHADAAALTVLIRLTTLWFSVFLGLLALPKKRIYIS